MAASERTMGLGLTLLVAVCACSAPQSVATATEMIPAVSAGPETTLGVGQEGGLPDVDKQFYLMEGDFYSKPSEDDPSRHVYSPERVSNSNDI